ncbi:MAG TPA: cyclase family protein [Vicinamibacteria bacterium]|nr:cyclase family protein [Vicinamibacteria bacterium]
MRVVTIIQTIGLSFSFIGALAERGQVAHAQSWTPPSREERCPTKWGAGDERGAANHMGPETVLRAARLIRTGEVIELGHVLSESVPLGDRTFGLYMKPTRMNPQSNGRGSNEELIVAEMGQVGTQFDGFAHQTIGDELYNCYDLHEVMTRGGFTRLGIENVGTLMTRGVLIDVAALKGVEILPDRYEITAADLEQALERQDVTIQAGDAVLIHTGWGRLYESEPERFSAGGPGIGIAAAKWLVEQDPMLVGADNAPVEVSPNPDPAVSLPVHQIMLVVNGIHLVERMKLDELRSRQVHEFAFVVQPLKLRGATGSTVAPVAIR